MKKAIKHILLLLVGCFFYANGNAQDLKQFTVTKNDNSPSYVINPVFTNPPDDYLSYNLTSKTAENYSWLALQKRFPNLFEKVENLLEGKEILLVTYYFNEKGIINFISFTTYDNFLPKLTDELLLEIYNTLKTVKIEDIEKIDNNKDRGNQIGMIRFYFRSKNR